MNFFNSDISLIQAEQQLEDYISSHSSAEFYLKDIPLTEEDFRLISRIVDKYSETIYSFDDYKDMLLLFIVNGYILSKTNNTAGVFSALFLDSATHIPQHHLRHLIYLIVNIFMEYNIATFGMTCNSLEDVINIIRKHAEI